MALLANSKRTDPRDRFRLAVNSVYEKDGQVIIIMEMPGVNTDNLELRIEENQLIVHGEFPDSNDGTYHLRERSRGPFHMVYTIDETIDRDKVQAEIRNGILRVVLERKEAEKPRRIEVKVG